MPNTQTSRGSTAQAPAQTVNAPPADLSMAMMQPAGHADQNPLTSEPIGALDATPSATAECFVLLSMSSASSRMASAQKAKKGDDNKAEDDVSVDRDDIKALMPLTNAELADAMDITQAVEAAEAEVKAQQDKASERAAASAGRGMLPFLGLGSRKASAPPSADPSVKAAGAAKTTKAAKKKKVKAAASPVAPSSATGSSGTPKAHKGRLLRLFHGKAGDCSNKATAAAADTEVPMVEVVLTPPRPQTMEQKAAKSGFKLGSIFGSSKGTSTAHITTAVIPEGAVSVPLLHLLSADGCVTSSAITAVLPAPKAKASSAFGPCSKGMSRLARPFKALFQPSAVKLQPNEL